jgi:hypothetical protein
VPGPGFEPKGAGRGNCSSVFGFCQRTPESILNLLCIPSRFVPSTTFFYHRNSRSLGTEWEQGWHCEVSFLWLPGAPAEVSAGQRCRPATPIFCGTRHFLVHIVRQGAREKEEKATQRVAFSPQGPSGTETERKTARRATLHRWSVLHYLQS